MELEIELEIKKNRRHAIRKHIAMPVSKIMENDDICCWVSDIGPGGVKLVRQCASSSSQTVCNLELHLVPGSIYTVVTGRRVWQDDDFEAYEFIAPSFAQQMMIEKMVGNL